MTPEHIILAMLWIIYCVLHSVLASQSVKQWFQKKMMNYKWYRLWYTLFAFIFLAAIIYYQIKIPAIELFIRTKFIVFAGVFLSVFGLVMMLICIRKYFMSLSGLRSLIVENFSSTLEITGVHKYVRHPLYLGTFAFIWGLFLLLPHLSLLISNTIITIYTLIGIELEEKKLIVEFGKDYQSYRKTVPKLIPFSKPKRSV